MLAPFISTLILRIHIYIYIPYLVDYEKNIFLKTKATITTTKTNEK